MNIIRKNYLLLLIIIYLIVLFILPWRGFYMLNDSYVYEWDVRNFFANNYHLHPLTSPTLLLQTFLGSIIYIFSKDPSLLRLMSSLFYLLGLIYLYKTFLLFKVKEKTAFLLTLVLMFNPLYMYSGFSFMSDIYFLSTFIVSHYYFIKFLKSSKSLDLGFSSVFAILSFLSRQTGIIILVAYLISYLLLKKKEKQRLLHIFLILLPLVAFVCYQLFYPLPVAYTQQSIVLTFSNLFHLDFYPKILGRVVKTCYYFGIMSFPVSIYYLIDNYKKFTLLGRIRLVLLFAVFSGIAAFFWFRNQGLMFYLPNIISYIGFNPRNLVFGPKGSFFYDMPVRAGAFYTSISILSLSILAFLIPKFVKALKNNYLLLPYLISSVTILSLSLIFRDYFDRYLLIFLPLLVIFLSLVIKINKPKIFVLLLVPLIVFSLVWQYDYLAFNKKVWEISDSVVLTGESVKSTFEYNLYHKLDKMYGESDPKILFDKSIWLDTDYDFIVSYSELSGYCTIEEPTYKSLLFKNGKGKIFLLRSCEND